MARIAAAETEDEETKKAEEADETAREERLLQWRIEMEREHAATDHDYKAEVAWEAANMGH